MDSSLKIIWLRLKNGNLSYTFACEDLCKSNMCRKELKEKTGWNKRHIAEDDSRRLAALCLSASLRALERRAVAVCPASSVWSIMTVRRPHTLLFQHMLAWFPLPPQIEIMSIQHIQNRSFTWQETLLHSWGDGGRPLHTGNTTRGEKRPNKRKGFYSDGWRRKRFNAGQRCAGN